MPEEQAIISLQVPEILNAWLEEVAARELTSKSAVARRILVEAQRKEEAQNVDARAS